MNEEELKSLKEMVKKIHDVLLGTFECKGLISTVKENTTKIDKHVKESEGYRAMIEESHRVCKSISESIKFTWQTIFRNILNSLVTALITSSLCGVLFWVTINKK